jgi:quinol monooxygenase YgiN
MFVVHVFIHVKPECIEAFKTATIENAQNSRKEPGIARFDILQQLDDPTRFELVEVYRTEADNALHRKTAHYNKWQSAVEPMQAEPRGKLKFTSVFPDDNGWDSPK